jgi:hypothetical protein
MTISNEISISGPYLGNGKTTAFPYDFKIFDAKHMRAVLLDPFLNAVNLELDSEYAVGGVGNEQGGAVIIFVPPPTGFRVFLVRSPPFTQETDLPNQGPYYAETVENRMDITVMQILRLKLDTDRAHKAPLGQAGGVFTAEDIARAQEYAERAEAALEEVLLALLGSGIAKTIHADYLRNVNTRLPNPSVSTNGNFLADGEIVEDGKIVFLSNQNSPVSNGWFQYTKATNTLTRIADFTDGDLFAQPLLAQIDAGNDFAGAIYSLSSPASGVVGSSPTVWTDALTGVGVQVANTFAAGPAKPYYGARPSTVRRLSPYDTPRYDNDMNVTNFSQSVYMNLNRFGYARDYIAANNVWSNAAALNAALTRHTTVVFDTPVYLKNQLTLQSRRRLVFLADVFMDNPGASFCDLTGLADITFEGSTRIRYIKRSNAGIKCIKGTGFQRFKAERIFTEGVDIAVSVDGAIMGFDIGSLGVGDLATDTPLFLSENHVVGSNARNSNVGKIEGAAPVQTLVQNANFNYYPYTYAETVVLSGAMTTNRTVVLTIPRNCTHGKKARLIHQASGGFTWSIGALTTISNGQFADIVFDGVTGAWVLLGKGTI